MFVRQIYRLSPQYLNIIVILLFIFELTIASINAITLFTITSNITVIVVVYVVVV